MYYVSPFTYLVDGMLSTGLANNEVRCSSIELRELQPLNGTCEQYMQKFLENPDHGYITDSTLTAIENCQFCPFQTTNSYLKLLSSDYSHRWRNFGIMWGFIGFNICAALFLYWLARVPKKQKILDSPPTENVSRVPTKTSKPEVKHEKLVTEAVDKPNEKAEEVRGMDGVKDSRPIDGKEAIA